MDEFKLLDYLEEIQPLNNDRMARRSVIQSEICTSLEEEEEYWHRRSSEMWLVKGDINTVYFHRIANGKEGRNVFPP